MPKFYKQLIENNKKWVEGKISSDPNYFDELSSGQAPPLLWIGCADSRVPANEITGTKPGDVFVHRNIANMVIHTDMSMLSVLDYAVNILNIKHIIVCGHYGCGGVQAAMGNKQYGIIDNWLRHIKDVYRLHSEELDKISNEQDRLNRFVELNVIEQVYDLCKTSIIQNSWKSSNTPHVHGWVYDLKNGLIKDLNVSLSDNTSIAEVFKVGENNVY